MKLGFFSLLTLLFIGLKLTDVIAWSWWLVLAPTLVPVVVTVAFFIWVGVKFQEPK